MSSIGQARTQDQVQVLIRSDAIADGDHIAVTHLPNAVSGLLHQSVSDLDITKVQVAIAHGTTSLLGVFARHRVAANLLMVMMLLAGA